MGTLCNGAATCRVGLVSSAESITKTAFFASKKRFLRAKVGDGLAKHIFWFAENTEFVAKKPNTLTMLKFLFRNAASCSVQRTISTDYSKKSQKHSQNVK